ncbi:MULTISPECIES: ABC transporter substrate-binding protein [Paraburkholderia]|uniref:HTH-type transcriptional regulator SgrR n=1 Tax=Paraburkholderia nemoris TaxID=2793076 RepID=A0ABM8SNX0_9BURK|nr:MULTISPECIES: ABC transporter substrate-binding protein [Paraburkholderia]MBK5183291.1 ABC transporter substrate-binding protein [Burkholderia sp. R-69749]MBK3814784.1 ABC transporter substrate-binding protein [Paraburkholderia aspalathi]CAE6823051.1 HTH-type transcriptional regulator SgrR [Paraburkholderia nemoris]CAE6835636.1 HTH-type transcriptional regulator SgrR [Paraburkholderia nemoris]CAE6858818.1 HTH-type transcriptional regulator SgrR [Paraburkholderia domus]
MQFDHSGETLLSPEDRARRRFLQLAGSSAVAISGSALFGSRAFAAETPKRGGHLILGIDTASSSDRLDPAFYFEEYMYNVGRQIFNTLTDLNDDGSLRPGLAESWASRDDARVWVIKLRRGVQFHNGKTLEPADVVYSLDHHRGKDSQSAAKSYLDPVKEIAITGPNELTFKLDSPNVDFPYLLGDVHFGITPKGADFSKGIGTGAYVLESFQPGVRVLTRRNPNYWDASRGFVDSVETVAYNDSAARVAAILSGSVHLINRVEPRLTKRLESVQAIRLHRARDTNNVLFPMLADQAPFKNNDVRTALKYAIDREQLRTSLLGGYGSVANDNPLFPSDRFYTADVPKHAYDPDKANFFWKKAAVTQPIVLSAADGATFDGAVSAAELYQASATKARIPFRVNRVPADGYWTQVWMKQPFCASSWANRPTADAYLSMICVSNAPWNESRWKSPAFDQLVAAARSESNDARRKQIYHDIQVLYSEQGASVIPLYADSLRASRSNLRGYVDIPGEVGSRAAEKVWFAS